MTRVSLPLAQSPILAYLHHAYPLSVVSGREDVKPWLYSQYVQLRCFKDVQAHKYRDLFNFYTTSSKMYEIVPHLKVERVSKSLITRWVGDDIVDFFTEAIDQGYYCIIYLNQFYKLKLFYFSNVEHIHELMIYGYDKETREFELYGFNGDDNLIQFRRSFDELIETFYAAPVEAEWQEHVQLIRYNPDSSFDFRIENMAAVLEDYLAGADSSLRFLLWKFPVDHDSVFGIETFKLLLDMLDMVERDELFLDHRIYRLIWEHKRLMTDRLRFLEKQGYLEAKHGWPDKYKEVEELSTAIRLGALKAIKLKTTNDLANMKRLVRLMMDREAELLTGVVQELREGQRAGEREQSMLIAQGLQTS